MGEAWCWRASAFQKLAMTAGRAEDVRADSAITAPGTSSIAGMIFAPCPGAIEAIQLKSPRREPALCLPLWAGQVNINFFIAYWN